MNPARMWIICLNQGRRWENDILFLILEDLARDDQPHDLVGSFQDLVDARIAEILLDLVVVEVAVATVHLERPVDDLRVSCSQGAGLHRSNYR